MKRFLSWIVLGIGLVLGHVILQLLASICVTVGMLVHEYSAIIFWVIIVLGGSFGLTIPYLLSVFISTKLYDICERIMPSRKGARYVVAPLIYGLLHIVALIRTFIGDFSLGARLSYLFGDGFTVVMCLLIFLAGLSNEV